MPKADENLFSSSYKKKEKNFYKGCTKVTFSCHLASIRFGLEFNKYILSICSMQCLILGRYEGDQSHRGYEKLTVGFIWAKP